MSAENGVHHPVILRLVVSVEHRLVTDGQTDRHTTTVNTRAN